MKSNTQHNLTGFTSKSPTSIITKIVSTVQSIFTVFEKEKNPARSKSIQVLEPKAKITKHDAIIGLLNQGKHYDHAALIAQTAEDWSIDLSTVDIDTLSVEGKSVWIDLSH